MPDLSRAWQDVQAALRALREQGGEVARQSAVPRWRQALQMARLRLGPGKLSPKDYHDMRLYRADLSWADKRQYLSLQAVSWHSRWTPIADDKLLTGALLAHAGVPTPRVLAICSARRAWGPVPELRTVADIRQHLLTTPACPFVSKPVNGIFSRDVFVVESVDPASGTVRLSPGPPMAIDAFATRCLAPPGGTMFQELLKPHPQIENLFGPRLCTLRMVVFADEAGVRLFRSILKIAVPPNVADNYWREGNIMARVDRDTGAIEQAMTGLGMRWRALDEHPVSGVAFRGLQVPDHARAVALVQRAARCMMGVPMQAWDVALTSQGPMALELNIVGSPFLVQTADGAGLLADADFRAFVERHRGRS